MAENSKFGILNQMSDEMLDRLAKMQNVVWEAMQRIKDAEEEILKKVFEHYSGEKLDFETPGVAKLQGARLTVSEIEGEPNRYGIALDGKHLGEVERDFIKFVVRFTPFDHLSKLAITDTGIEVRD